MLTEQFLSALRVIMITCGTVLVNKKFIDMETLQNVVGAILIVGPALWSQYRIWKRSKEGEQKQ